MLRAAMERQPCRLHIEQQEKTEKKKKNRKHLANQTKRIDKQAGLNNPHGIGPRSPGKPSRYTERNTHQYQLIQSSVSNG